MSNQSHTTPAQTPQQQIDRLKRDVRALQNQAKVPCPICDVSALRERLKVAEIQAAQAERAQAFAENRVATLEHLGTAATRSAFVAQQAKKNLSDFLDEAEKNELVDEARLRDWVQRSRA